MANNEHAPVGHEYEHDPGELKEQSEQEHERLKERHESNVDRAAEQNTHEALRDVEQAFTKERESTAHERVATPEKPLEHRINRQTKKANFDHAMSEVRTQMSPASRAFSKLIHNRPVERTSEVVGSTIARPNAILSGAVFAFILTLAVYLIGHYFGYPLSGFESIAAFILGWVIGILYDFLRVMITGKKA